MTTLQTLLDQLRGDLDEPVEAVWKDTDLTVWLNAGIYRAQSVLKGTREDWQTIRRKSTDGTVTIAGASYDCASFKVASGTSFYTMPPDLLEIRVMQPATQADRDAGISFLPRDLVSVDFQSALRSQDSTIVGIQYLYELIGLNQLVIAPTPAQAIEIELYYISFTGSLALGDTITNVPEFALSTVKAYAYYRALRSVQHPDTTRAQQAFMEEKEELKSYAHPRKSQDPEVVEGAFDDYDQQFFGLHTS